MASLLSEHDLELLLLRYPNLLTHLHLIARIKEMDGGVHSSTSWRCADVQREYSKQERTKEEGWWGYYNEWKEGFAKRSQHCKKWSHLFNSSFYLPSYQSYVWSLTNAPSNLLSLVQNWPDTYQEFNPFPLLCLH
jgi:hypothetical protein